MLLVLKISFVERKLREPEKLCQREDFPAKVNYAFGRLEGKSAGEVYVILR